MKNKIIALVLLGSVLLTGCKSTRTTYQTASTTQSTIKTTYSIEDCYTYILSDPTSDSVIDEIESIFAEISNMPGLPVDQVVSINGHVSSSSFYTFDNFTFASGMRDVEKPLNYISKLDMSGFSQNSNGVICCEDKLSRVVLSLHLADFETAKTVYDYFKEECDNGVENITDSQWNTFNTEGESVILNHNLDGCGLCLTLYIKTN